MWGVITAVMVAMMTRGVSSLSNLQTSKQIEIQKLFKGVLIETWSDHDGYSPRFFAGTVKRGEHIKNMASPPITDDIIIKSLCESLTHGFVPCRQCTSCEEEVYLSDSCGFTTARKCVALHDDFDLVHEKCMKINTDLYGGHKCMSVHNQTLINRENNDTCTKHTCLHGGCRELFPIPTKADCVKKDSKQLPQHCWKVEEVDRKCQNCPVLGCVKTIKPMTKGTCKNIPIYAHGVKLPQEFCKKTEKDKCDNKQCAHTHKWADVTDMPWAIGGHHGQDDHGHDEPLVINTIDGVEAVRCKEECMDAVVREFLDECATKIKCEPRESGIISCPQPWRPQCYSKINSLSIDNCGHIVPVCSPDAKYCIQAANCTDAQIAVKSERNEQCECDEKDACVTPTYPTPAPSTTPAPFTTQFPPCSGPTCPTHGPLPSTSPTPPILCPPRFGGQVPNPLCCKGDGCCKGEDCCRTAESCCPNGNCNHNGSCSVINPNTNKTVEIQQCKETSTSASTPVPTAGPTPASTSNPTIGPTTSGPEPPVPKCSELDQVPSRNTSKDGSCCSGSSCCLGGSCCPDDKACCDDNGRLKVVGKYCCRGDGCCLGEDCCQDADTCCFGCFEACDVKDGKNGTWQRYDNRRRAQDKTKAEGEACGCRGSPVADGGCDVYNKDQILDDGHKCHPVKEEICNDSCARKVCDQKKGCATQAKARLSFWASLFA